MLELIATRTFTRLMSGKMFEQEALINNHYFQN